MEDFHDVRFPLHLAYGTSGGPRRPTDILQMANGSEVRNAKGRHSRRTYNAIAGIKTEIEATELIHFFEARRGPLCGFRFRDPLDHKSADPVTVTDQIIGTGDGHRKTFQLVKTYGDDPHAYIRPITKPVDGTVNVAVDGVQNEISCDLMTGQVTFETAPVPGSLITAGFEFDVPVRFASDALDITLDDFGAMQIQDVPLIEIHQAAAVSTALQDVA